MPRTSLAFVLLLALTCSAQTPGAPGPPEPTFSELLQQLSTLPPDPCGTMSTTDESHTSAMLFRRAGDTALAALNSPSTLKPALIAEQTLRNLEQESARVNALWPDENRFHFKVVEVAPLLVVTLSIRTEGRFIVLAIPEQDYENHPNHRWTEVGSSEDRDFFPPTFNLEIYPLHRGPSGRARFLAKTFYSGCAGSYGGVYDVREWDPASNGNLSQLLKQDNAIGLNDNDGRGPTQKNPFNSIGELRTTGSRLVLPFCWFSAIDTWDNPSLCALDTWNLSADQPRFVSRAYNRPDLVPIARAIEYASQHDYPAVLAYCASPAVAKQLAAFPPSLYGAGNLEVHHTGPNTEQVDIGDFDVTRYTVEKRAGRWLITSIHNR